VAETFQHLGPFSDLVAAARASRQLLPSPRSAVEARHRAGTTLRFTLGGENPSGIATERTWVLDGIVGEELTWSVGFGPRSSAWLLRPEGAAHPLPGVVALHDHGNLKRWGKEKIADGPDAANPAIASHRDTYYGGRAFANALANGGFVVLVPDTFLWGSRRFPLDTMPPYQQRLADPISDAMGFADSYEGAAYLHEGVVAKYCAVLGTSIAAITAYEDRVALNYLRGRFDVDSARIAAVGFSGGGLRASLLGATAGVPLTRVIAGMMSTYDGLLDHNVAGHTWMLFPEGWATQGDLPDLAAAGAPSPLLTQYALDDGQFTVEGMRASDMRIAALYAAYPAAEAYTSQFFAGRHRFDLEMQDAAFEWLHRQFLSTF
jgi:dienelactone hydrolase